MEQQDTRGRAGLKRFSDLSGFAVAPDDPDIRGWDVVGADGQVIGEVDDLFVDTDRMKVREVDVDVKNGGHVSVPIERVQVDHERRQVTIQGLAGSAGSVIAADEYARESPPAGEAVVRRQVETEWVREPVSPNHEEAGIRRRSVQPGTPAEAVGRAEDEIRVPPGADDAVSDESDVRRGAARIDEAPRRPSTRRRE